MKRLCIYCILVLSILFTACAEKKNEISEKEQSLTTESTKGVNSTPTTSPVEEIEKIKTEKITETPPPTIAPEPVEPEIVEGIHCRVEGDTVIFYGSGVLTGSLAYELMQEVNHEEVCKLVIGKGITEIENLFFSAYDTQTATWMESLRIEGVKTIGSYAFAGCQNLKEVVLAEGVECIEEWAFSSCKALEKVSFANSIKRIGSDAF